MLETAFYHGKHYVIFVIIKKITTFAVLIM
jgi:hypothetical protein